MPYPDQADTVPIPSPRRPSCMNPSTWEPWLQPLIPRRMPFFWRKASRPAEEDGRKQESTSCCLLPERNPSKIRPQNPCLRASGNPLVTGWTFYAMLPLFAPTRFPFGKKAPGPTSPFVTRFMPPRKRSAFQRRPAAKCCCGWMWTVFSCVRPPRQEEPKKVP